MVSNPVKRKSRNSFLIGATIMLIICVIVGILLYFFINKKEKEKENKEGKLTYAYRLKQAVRSGDNITSIMVEPVLVTQKAVPTDAFPSKKLIVDKNKKEKWENVAFPAIYKSKLDLAAGTILSNTLLYEGEDENKDLRSMEYNMLILPTTIKTGDYIDIRLTFANGQDLIVISKKQIKSLRSDTIELHLTEDEILMMESAIVESYIMPASKLYAVKYIEAGNQDAAAETYVPTVQVKNLIEINDNIVAEARDRLKSRFSESIRMTTNEEVEKYDLQKEENVEKGIKKEIEKAKAAREAYLSSLTANSNAANKSTK